MSFVISYEYFFSTLRDCGSYFVKKDGFGLGSGTGSGLESGTGSGLGSGSESIPDWTETEPTDQILNTGKVLGMKLTIKYNKYRYVFSLMPT